MKPCKGCGAEYRKGRRRLLLQPDGSLTSALVCDACAKRSLAIVAPIVPLAPPVATSEALAVARVHREQIRAAKQRVRIYMASASADASEGGPDERDPYQARERDAESRRQYHMGRVDGLGTALELLTVIEEGRMP